MQHADVKLLTILEARRPETLRRRTTPSSGRHSGFVLFALLLVCGVLTSAEIEAAVCLRDVALDPTFQFIRFADVSRLVGRAAMSYVVAFPEMLSAAAPDLAGIGSSLSEANAAAVAPTTGVMAAAGDEVSAAIASLFSSVCGGGPGGAFGSGIGFGG